MRNGPLSQGDPGQLDEGPHAGRGDQQRLIVVTQLIVVLNLATRRTNTAVANGNEKRCSGAKLVFVTFFCFVFFVTRNGTFTLKGFCFSLVFLIGSGGETSEISPASLRELCYEMRRYATEHNIKFVDR